MRFVSSVKLTLNVVFCDVILPNTSMLLPTAKCVSLLTSFQSYLFYLGWSEELFFTASIIIFDESGYRL